MQIISFVIILLFFILLDITKINHLWDENIHRRILHHTQRGQYDPNKKTWINFIKNYLTKENIEYINKIKTEKKNCMQSFSPLISNLFGGNYSKKCTLYYNDFDLETQKKLDNIGKSMIPKLEKIVGKKLYLGESNFRCVLLKYEGPNSQFVMHYDTEPNNCYRTLFIIKKEGIVPPFIYHNEKGEKIEKYLNEGDGIFFQGTKTFHGVGKSKDPNMKRYMIGWQYTTDNSIEDINLCSKLRDADIIKITKLIVPYILQTLILSLFIWKFLNDPLSKNQIKALLLLTVIVIVMSYTVPLFLQHTNIGTGLVNKINSIVILLCFSLLCFGNIYYTLLFYNYLLLTEMFLPRSIVGKKLKIVL